MSKDPKPQPVPAGRTTGTRRGELMWWLFNNAATPLPDLAEVALNTGFPTLYLPMPVSRLVAFQRAMQRATASVPRSMGRWQTNRWTDRGAVPEDIVGEFLEDAAVKEWLADVLPESERTSRDAAKLFLERSTLGILLKWDREQGTAQRPWCVRLWCALPPAGDPVIVHTPGDSKNREMESRVRRLFDEEMSLAMAPEIGDSVMEALADASGLRIRPGMWTVPGEPGVELVTAATTYLRAAGDTQAGQFDLLDLRPETEEVAKAARLSLKREALALVEAVEVSIEEEGTGALRSRWSEIRALEDRLDAHRPLTGGDDDEIRALLAEARERLVEEARRRDIGLDRKAPPASKQALWDALQLLRAGAQDRDPKTVAEVDALLVKAQRAALAAGLAAYLRRLRTFAVVAAGRRNATLFAALASATDFVRRKAARAYPEKFG